MPENPQRKTSISRRRFMTGLAVSAAGLSVVDHRSAAQDMPILAEDDPTAASLKYVANAADADASLRKDGSFCHNCALYTGATEADYGPCSIFPGKQVAAGGWCSVWAPKPSG